MHKPWHTFKSQSASLGDDPLAVRLHASNLGACPQGLCFILPSRDAAHRNDDLHPEFQLYSALAAELDRYKIHAVMTALPQAKHEDSSTTEAIVERYKATLGLFRFAHQNFPQLPAIVLAADEGAAIGWQILRSARPEIESILRLFVIGSRVGRDSPELPSCELSWLCDELDFAEQIRSSHNPAWRRLLAKNYAQLLKKSLDAASGQARSAAEGSVPRPRVIGI